MRILQPAVLLAAAIVIVAFGLALGMLIVGSARDTLRRRHEQ